MERMHRWRPLHSEGPCPPPQLQQNQMVPTELGNSPQASPQDLHHAWYPTGNETEQFYPPDAWKIPPHNPVGRCLAHPFQAESVGP